MLNLEYEFEFSEIVVDGSLFGTAQFQNSHDFHIDWVFTVHFRVECKFIVFMNQFQLIHYL